MAFIPTSNAARLEVRQELDLQLVEQIFWFVKSGFDGADLQALVDIVEAYWTTTIMPLLSVFLTYREVYARGMRFISDIDKRALGESGTAGGSAAQSLPNNVAFSVELGTGQTGRSKRGRTYATGIPENEVAQSIADPGFTLDYLTAIAGIGAQADSVGWDWVVCSQYSGIDGEGKPIPRAAGVVTPITVVSKYDNVVDSQRRRLPGRGT